MLHKQKVSIIVPIYKVEKYIHRCIDSILGQSYANLEIILVNDGSPDNSGVIADMYKESDHRIKVIHKKNGGLSDARNEGMKLITGEYTVFVDSDDWMDKNMIKIMVENSLKYEAEVVQTAFYYAYPNKLLIDHRYFSEDDKPTVLHNTQLMYELVKNKKIKNFAWGKLYKTEIVRDIPFTNGVLFEDVFWAHQVMHKVNSYVILHQPLFYYFQREDSIVSTYSPRNIDMIKGLQERHRFIEQHYEELIDESYKHILKMSLIHYNLLILNSSQKNTKELKQYIKAYIDKHYTVLKNAVRNHKELKIQLQLFSCHPYCNIIFLFLRKLLRKARILSKPIGLKQVNI